MTKFSRPILNVLLNRTDKRLLFQEWGSNCILCSLSHLPAYHEIFSRVNWNFIKSHSKNCQNKHKPTLYTLIKRQTLFHKSHDLDSDLDLIRRQTLFRTSHL